ncbi:MAG: isoprenylcysteine carboxylmethyltransferase family protein [Deltaproteobacteria bacterium]|nr:isoprenylcysteine carboxylmethyltransferase family protein [Deltaproteobacteria bacterium]
MPEPFISRVRDFISRNRVRLSFIVFIPCIIEDVYDGFAVRNFLTADDPFGLAAFIFVLFGIYMRSWAAGVLIKGKKVAMTGPYALTRHPLYVGSFFIALGFCMLFGDLKDFIVFFAVILLLYIPTIRHEEMINSNKFKDEWAAYARNTWLFFPKRFPRNVLGAWNLSQWLKNKEYMAASASIGGLVLFYILRVYIVK